ncbi:MerR family transcriptional regulator [Niveispirillum sp. KHB5.9]|uniref:MerR family transcriptional regulator n=1 Tax=Niveispirillum sp. KHB5.9 TaxID=3400269 RepID=UPI003A88BB5B
MLSTIEQAKHNASPTQTFTIGQLADEFGLTLRSLRFYEDEGLISPARVGQARIYTTRDRARLKLICRGKRLGFSIGEIKDFLDLYDTDEAQVEQMTYLLRGARARIRHLEQQLRDVQQTLKELHEIDGMIVSHLVSKGVPTPTE